MILSGKCENSRNFALFRSKTHFCVFFAPKRKKPALARNLAVANAFLVILGAVFAKKRKRADFAVLGDFSTSGRKNLLLRPKSGKSQKCTKIEKSRFSPEAPNPLKHKHLGTFLEPETHKCAFFTFGLTFPSWSVFGAKSAPEVENKQNSAFSSQKWKIAFLRFWSKKGAQNVTFIKGFALLAERVEFRIFAFPSFFRFYVAQRKTFMLLLS